MLIFMIFFHQNIFESVNDNQPSKVKVYSIIIILNQVCFILFLLLFYLPSFAITFCY
jgi:hypothetical protein